MEPKLLKSLLKPQSYPEATASVHLIQTHVSFIFITDNFVYKIKKPVDFGFLNFSTLDRRRFYCNEEVRLNRRLCPDIYLGVVEVRESPAGATLTGDGKVIDYAVKMKRLPAERMLDRLLAEDKVTDNDIRRIARTIAEFHLNAERGEEIDSYGSIENIKRNWEENFQQVVEFIDDSLAQRDLQIIRDWTESFIADNERLFAERISRGFIRDCDGDIHLENICLTDHVYIFDCIEFNNRFRYSDTAADIAFFLMDLDYHGRSAFAEVFLTEYAAVTGDRGIVNVLDFYMVYRAFVRGKVESFRLLDPVIPEHEKKTAREKAIRYFRLARGYIIRRKLPPTLIITCGLMGSGKSTVASALARELGMAIAASDPVRKEILAIPADSRVHDEYGTGIYSPEFSAATYKELLARGEKALTSGHSIIIDATFRSKSDRALFRNMSERLGVSFRVIQTVCKEKLIKQRLDNRMQRAQEVSDGRWELFNRQKEDFEQLDGDEGALIFVDTSRPINDNIDEILTNMGLL
ncbi:MAG: hypothetical protein FD174_681 [Geobacteraceae bacterium]|nr:MAG: hypothetical protein FD174_681 [Geobacteraceae bacterium]